MYPAFAICFVAGVAATTVLALHGHPWLGAAVLLATAGLTFGNPKP